MIRLLLSLVREGATLFISGEIAKRATRRLVAAVVMYAILALFALAAIAFLYLFLYRRIAASTGEEYAAAILCGANIALIALILIVRAILRAIRRPQPTAAILGSPEFDAALALGLSLEKKLRKSAPQAALTAVVIGLIVGLRPEILDLFRSRKPGSDRE